MPIMGGAGGSQVSLSHRKIVSGTSLSWGGSRGPSVTSLISSWLVPKVTLAIHIPSSAKSHWWCSAQWEWNDLEKHANIWELCVDTGKVWELGASIV